MMIHHCKSLSSNLSYNPSSIRLNDSITPEFTFSSTPTIITSPTLTSILHTYSGSPSHYMKKSHVFDVIDENTKTGQSMNTGDDVDEDGQRDMAQRNIHLVIERNAIHDITHSPKQPELGSPLASYTAWFTIGDVVHNDCKTSQQWLIIARRYEAQHKWDFAIQAYSRAISMNPYVASLYSKIAGCFMELRQWHQCITVMRLAIKLNPSYGIYYYNLAFACTECRRWYDAIQALQVAIYQNPKRAFYYNLLGVCYRHIAEWKLCVQAYKKAICLDVKRHR